MNNQPQEPEPSRDASVREFVILWESSYRENRSVVEVVRRTKTQIIVRQGDKERRFMASSHREVGSSGWSVSRIQEATPAQLAEVREEMHRRALIARIQCVEWHKLSTAQLGAVAGSVVLAVDPSRSSPDALTPTPMAPEPRAR